MPDGYRPEMHVSLDSLDPEGEHIPTQPDGMDIQAVEKKLLMQKVLGRLKDEDVELLYDRYVSMMTLREMADERGVTPQAVEQRTRTARANFLSVFAEAWGSWWTP